MTNFNITIRIGIVGPVSTGKSTFINSLFGKTYSQMKLRRTTMNPQIYHENIDNIDSDNDIIIINTEANNLLFEKLNKSKLVLDDIKELHHNVNYILDRELLNLDKFCTLDIYDIPGINDSCANELYIDYLKKIMPQLDIILLFLDIKSALNTSDEMDIINIITNYIKNNHENNPLHMITILNKCDNMRLDVNNNLKIDQEYEEIYLQVLKIVDEINHKKNISKYGNYVNFLCSEDMYMYRTAKYNLDNLEQKYIEKMGENIIGKYQWSQLNSTDKLITIKNFLNSMDYQQILKLCGYEDLIKTLNKVMESKHIYYKKRLNDYITKYNLVSIDSDNYENIIDNLEKTKIIISDVDQIHGTEYKTLITDFQKKIMTSYVKKLIFTEIKNDQDLNNLENANEILFKLRQNDTPKYFNDFINTVDNLIENNSKLCVKYIYNRIENSNSTEKIGFYVSNILKKNKLLNDNDCENSIIKSLIKFIRSEKYFVDSNILILINDLIQLGLSIESVFLVLTITIEKKINTFCNAVKSYPNSVNLNKIGKFDTKSSYCNYINQYLYKLKYLMLNHNDFDIIKNFLIKIDNIINVYILNISQNDFNLINNINLEIESEYIKYIEKINRSHLEKILEQLKITHNLDINNNSYFELSEFENISIREQICELEELNLSNEDNIEDIKKAINLNKTEYNNKLSKYCEKVENVSNKVDRQNENFQIFKKEINEISTKIEIEQKKKIDDIRKDIDQTKEFLNKLIDFNKKSDNIITVLENIVENRETKIKNLLNTVTVLTLRKLCDELNISIEGVKNVLVDRLAEHINEKI